MLSSLETYTDQMKTILARPCVKTKNLAGSAPIYLYIWKFTVRPVQKSNHAQAGPTLKKVFFFWDIQLEFFKNATYTRIGKF